jgi:hypothetical protein
MSESDQVKPKREIKTWQIVLVFLIFAMIIGKASETFSSSDSSNSTDSSNSSSWIPAGFESWDSNVAYKWVDNPTCQQGLVCAAIQVVANKDCPNNLYAELLLQDKNYVQYDYTNDSQGSLSRGNTAELTFNFPADARFANFKISKISCH